MNRTILVVDDDPIYSEFVTEVAEKYQDQVLSAADVSSALALLEDHRVDLIVCDVDLPVMGGLSFQSALSRNERFRNIPFVFMTSSPAPEVVRYARDVVHAKLIVKSDLIRSLHDLLKV